MRYEYRVCFSQEMRVTFANGAWQGQSPPDAQKAAESLMSCQHEWEYLNAVGAEGWELVAVVGGGGEAPTRYLYLRRGLP